MSCFNLGGNGCCWILILILLMNVCGGNNGYNTANNGGCGCGGNDGCGCGCGNNNGCGCGC